MPSAVYYINPVCEYRNVSRPEVAEDPDTYRNRWRSIKVMYLTMFLSSVTFSITMTSIWPFLHLLDSDASTDFLGWVVAAYSVGQLVASPMFGYWANCQKKSRIPLAVSLVIELLSNVLYTYMESFPNYRKFYLILARGLIGFGAGNVAVVRSYISGATTVRERTGAMANVSIFQTIGFILGPAIQAALVPLGHPGPVHSDWFHFDMYTSPGFFGAILSLINLVLLFVIFREHRLVEKESCINSSIQDNSYEEIVPPYTPDYVAVVASISVFFVVLFIFTVFETIATPLSMNEFAWPKDKATLYNGIILATAGVEAIVVFTSLKFLSKRINERFLLIGGFIVCLLGYFVFLPWGNQLPIRSPALIVSDSTTGATEISKAWSLVPTTETMTINSTLQWNENSKMNTTVFSSAMISSGIHGTDVNATTEKTVTTIEPEGCPSTMEWCNHTPRIYLAQYLSGVVLISAGYPCTSVMMYTIYSKILGPKPQGTWMGWLTASGSLARTVGPIFVSQIYTAYGPRVTFATDCGVIILTIIGICIVFKRLVPFSFTTKVENQAKF